MFNPDSDDTQVCSRSEWEDALRTAGVDPKEGSVDLGSTPVDMFLPPEEVAALDAAACWNPSEDQETGLATLLDAFRKSGPYVLDGSAGTGKTTLVRALLRRLTPEWEIVLVAFMWRAANRLSDVVGLPATSIHAVVYGAPVQRRRCPACEEWSSALMKAKTVWFTLNDAGDPQIAENQGNPPAGSFDLPRYQCSACNEYHEDATRFPQRLDFELATPGDCAPPRYRLVVVDEVGMVSPKVRRDIQKTFEDDRTRVLGVGDRNQNPWVTEFGESEEDYYYLSLTNPTVSLNQTHRQVAGDPVLRIAQDLKVYPEPSGVQWPFPFRVPGVRIDTRVPLQNPAIWAAKHRLAGRDLALITFSNKTRAALNALVRDHTGATAYAHAQGARMIPGDRLLARSNTAACGVFNGELFDLCAVEPVTGALLNEDGRIVRKRTAYEHDRILEGGVVVLRVDLARVGDPNHARISILMACPRGSYGLPILESDLIMGGWSPSDARQRCREVSRAWSEEYTAGVVEREPEFELRRSQAEGKRIARARFLSATNEKEILRALRSVRRCGVDDALVDEVEREALAGTLTGVKNRVGVFDRFKSTFDVAAECDDALDYCNRVYGAVDPKTVCTLDFGEALTCHAMQGSEAEHVGVVFDGPFWGAWKNDRTGALRWSYTAVTRSAGNLALFSIRREG